MTLPRSSGCTRTSRTRPLRMRRARTWTSSACSTMPFTRCSRASSSTSGLAFRLLLGHGRGLDGGRGLGYRGLVNGRGLGDSRGLDSGGGRSGLFDLGGLLGLAGRGGSRTGVATGEGLLGRSLVDRVTVGLGSSDEERRGGLLALELLPVTGQLEKLHDRLGRLRADAQPVGRPLGVDLDARGVLLRVVETDLLDRPAITLGAAVGDDDAVLRVADHSEPLELDLDCHCCGLSCYRAWVNGVSSSGAR